MLEISEIFYSIQGESTFSGLPCTFVRLAGCNLSCSYCDARYACEEPGRAMTVETVMAQVRALPCPLVEVTGGEPLLQYDVLSLLTRLGEEGYTVLLETNGSLPLHEVPPEVHIIMDIKCPGSGEAASLHPDNPALLRRRLAETARRDQVKFVISSAGDYQWAKEAIDHLGLAGCAEILFSPVTDRIDPGDLADLILRDHLPVRLQLQLHLALWPGSTRGR